MMSSASAHTLTLLACGIAIFSVTLLAPMPWTLVLLLLLTAGPVLTMRGVRGGAEARKPDTALDSHRTQNAHA